MRRQLPRHGNARGRRANNLTKAVVVDIVAMEGPGSKSICHQSAREVLKDGVLVLLLHVIVWLPAFLCLVFALPCLASYFWRAPFCFFANVT